MTAPTTAIQIGSRELSLGSFRLQPTGLIVRGTPTRAEWEQCGEVLHRMEGAVQWWIGDWLNYGERAYGEKYTEAIEATGYDEHSLRQYAWVANKVALSIRIDNVSYGVHMAVAPLPPEQQREILARAAAENLTVGQTKAIIRTQRLETRAPSALAGVFDVLCADPPWAYSNSGFDQSAASQYPTLAIDAIAALPLTDPTFPKAADNSVLFLWATSPLLGDSFAVMSAWGFTYRASLVWAKDRAPGIGWWVRTKHELLLIGERGGFHPAVMPESVIAARAGRHSEKPSEFYTLIESMYPQFRRVELFARVARPGWAAWGNQV